jgi:hypothetical protein
MATNERPCLPSSPGRPRWGRGPAFSARELARFAGLHLTGGRFRGRQLLAPASVAANLVLDRLLGLPAG